MSQLLLTETAKGISQVTKSNWSYQTRETPCNDFNHRLGWTVKTIL